MPSPLSDEIKERIIQWYYEDQSTMAEIAAQARCSIGLVSKVLRNYRDYGQDNDPFRQHTGRPSKLSEADLKYIDTKKPYQCLIFFVWLWECSRGHAVSKIWI